MEYKYQRKERMKHKSEKMQHETKQNKTGNVTKYQKL